MPGAAAAAAASLIRTASSLFATGGRAARGLRELQALLPLRRALAPPQAQSGLAASLAVLFMLVYIAVSSTLASVAEKEGAARRRRRSLMARFVRAYAQLTSIALLVCLSFEVPKHLVQILSALSASYFGASAPAGAGGRVAAAALKAAALPPPRLVYFWISGVIFLATDVVLSLAGALRPVSRLASVAAPSLRLTAFFRVCEEAGCLGDATDLILPRLGALGACFFLAVLGRS